ncbi:hypothetical protein [Streptomyces brevispora]
MDVYVDMSTVPVMGMVMPIWEGGVRPWRTGGVILLVGTDSYVLE